MDQSPPEIPEWFAKAMELQKAHEEERDRRLNETIDKRFEGFREKHFSQALSRPPDNATDKEEPRSESADRGSLTREDLIAARRLGVLEQHIPSKEARERLDQIIASRGFAAAAEWAEDLVKYTLPANGNGAAAQNGVIRGHGASPAHSSASMPQSMSEYRELKRTDPKRAREVLEVLDLSALPNR